MQWIYLLLFFFTFSCVRIPKEEAKAAIMGTPSFDHSRQTALSSNSFREIEELNPCWWEMFGDAQLTNLIEKALAQSPLIKEVESRLERAQAEATAQKSQLFPTIGFSAEVDWQYFSINDLFRAFAPVFPANVNEYKLNLNFTYEFDFWGKNRNLFQAAIGEERALEAEKEQVKIILSTTVAVSYFKLQSLFAKLNIIKNERKIFTSLFDLVKLRQKNALNSEIPTIDAQEKIFEINQNVIFTENQIALEKFFLKQLIGQGPESPLCLQEKDLERARAFPLPKEVFSDLLAHRPDLMAQIWRVEAAAHKVGAAKTAFYPSIDLSGLAGLDSVFFHKLFRWESRSWELSPSLYLPIFTAGRIKANLKAKQAEFYSAIYAYNELLLKAAKEVTDEIHTLRTKDEEVKTQYLIVQNQKQKRSLIQSRFTHALDSLLDLLNEDTALLQVKLREVQLQYERYLATIKLIKALGGGYIPKERVSWTKK
ncbi:MAG: efflux transporter outer membrane subunit [Chlamydiae bacterium]|nr:efflux transporter outer membrane subunit [Chlamydiota bacterium]